MPNFRYSARSRDGASLSGNINGADRAAVVAELQARDLLPVEVVEARVTEGAPAIVSFHSAKTGAALFGGVGTLVEAGVPLDQSLATFGEIAADPALTAVAGRVREGLRRGSGLAGALAAETETGKGFEPLAIGLVAAGEATGQLVESLQRLARLYERRQRISDAVRSALIYPAILATVTVLVLALLMAFVIPQFELLFREGQKDLPFVTRVVFGASHLLGKAFWVLIPLALIAWLAVRRLLAQADVRLRWDRALLGVPVVGSVIRGVESERIGFVLASLLGAGVNLPDALRYAADVVQNRALSALLTESSLRLRAGERFADVLANAELLPPMFVRLAAIGEASGTLPVMLTKIATLYEQESESRIRRMVALVEPAMVILLGGLIALTMVAVLTAIVDLNRLTV